MIINTTRHRNILPECLIQKPEYLIVNSFNDVGYKALLEGFNRAINAGWDIIPVVIDSYGGQVHSCMGMVDILKSSPVPVATIIETKAMSCGAILASCGTKGYRYMSPYASLMIHQVSNSEKGKIDDIKVSVEHAEQLNEDIFEIFNKNSGNPKKFFQEKIKARTNTDYYLSAQEAKDFGIIDKIGVPRMEINIIQNVSLFI